jgi:hypothetical protein
VHTTLDAYVRLRNPAQERFDEFIDTLAGLA